MTIGGHGAETDQVGEQWYGGTAGPKPISIADLGVTKAVRGKDEVTEAVRIAHGVQSASSYTSIIATPDLLVELFDCDADGYPMEGMWIQRINRDGLVNELTVYLRPCPAVTVLRNRAKQIAQQGKFLGGADYWELPRP